MQTQRPQPPLRIPSEDNVPLFDPSGLSASLSADDWANSFDLSSVAASRLGIKSTPSRDGSPSTSFAQSSGQAAAVPNSRSTSLSPAASARDAGAASEATDPASKVRMWWQRGGATPPSAEDQKGADAGQAGVSPALGTDDHGRFAAASSLEASSVDTVSLCGPQPRTPRNSEPGEKQRQSQILSDSTRAGSSPQQPCLITSNLSRRGPQSAGSSTLPSASGDAASPVVRSPAADFLSSFSNLHSVASPASSVGAGSSYGGPLADRDGKRSASSPADRSGSTMHGLGQAAAQLYTGGRSAANAGLRPDDEGSCFGPEGRYIMGRTIGFGGFSTVREGFDTQRLSQDSSEQAAETATTRRVAVKIVYNTREGDEVVRGAAKRHSQWSQELEIWRSLPAHPHLLPLLHSEVVELPQGSGSHVSGAASSAELLVMPFCDRGNLLDYVRSEGGARASSVILGSAESGRGTPKPSSLSRSASLNTSLGNGYEASRSIDSGRTGSGFLQRGGTRRLGLGRVPSASGAVPPANVPWALNASQLQFSSTSNISSPSSLVGSLSSGSGLLRRASSSMSRSRGVPIEAARQTMRQLASALATLHGQAGVLHSDLKLENVLGQGLRSNRASGPRPLSGISDGADGISGGLPISSSASVASSLDGTAGLEDLEEPVPCWRVADFGLARRIKSDGDAEAEALRASLLGGPSRSSTASEQSRGGSLAYTAPEFLRAKTAAATTPGNTTPAASSSAANTPELPASPFAPDMWALGCILYALLSGRLPFADSFEPRLQMKIAKAQWEIPSRLRRRAQRLADASRSNGARHAREVSGGSSTFTSVESGGVAGDRPLSTLIEGRHVGPFGWMRAAAAADFDMSASLPSLPPKDRPTRHASLFEPFANSHTVAASRPSDHVVGSAPGRADHVERLEINRTAKALADAEVDPESDEDDTLEPEFDGLSWDRAAAREVLHGLLEPDPTKRWTVDRLCAAAWLRDAEEEGLPAGSAAARAPVVARPDDNVAGPAAVRDKRASLLGQSISERPSQETMDGVLDFRKRESSQSRDQDGPKPDAAPSTLAQSRPADLSSQSSDPVSPSLPTSRSGFDDSHSSASSRPISRGSFRDHSESRSRSTGLSESSTPSRGDITSWHASAHAGVHHHHALDVSNWPTISRCDSPADSERRGRQSRSRMADLDENQTWSVDKDQSAAERYSEWRTGRTSVPVPIPIRSQSHSRSRSRHSRESGSPDRIPRRSTSRPRPLLPGSYDAAGGGGAAFLRGRSYETSGVAGGAAKADQTQAHRSSTSRSRSRAPDALAQILGRDRATSRSRGTPVEEVERVASRSSSGVNLAQYSGGSASVKDGADGASRGHGQQPPPTEARGRARDRR